MLVTEWLYDLITTISVTVIIIIIIITATIIIIITKTINHKSPDYATRLYSIPVINSYKHMYIYKQTEQHT